jgi:hypothetical protein
MRHHCSGGDDPAQLASEKESGHAIQSPYQRNGRVNLTKSLRCRKDYL